MICVFLFCCAKCSADFRLLNLQLHSDLGIGSSNLNLTCEGSVQHARSKEDSHVTLPSARQRDGGKVQ